MMYGTNLRLDYSFSGVPQVQNGSMFVEPQVRDLLLWLCHIRDRTETAANWKPVLENRPLKASQRRCHQNSMTLPIETVVTPATRPPFGLRILS